MDKYELMTVDRYIGLFKAVEKNTGKPLDLDSLVAITFEERGGALVVPPTDDTLLVLSNVNAHLWGDLWPEIKRRWEGREVNA